MQFENEKMIGNKIKGLGEIILRVNDMELMKYFYHKTIGFELISESENYIFSKLQTVLVVIIKR